MSAPLYQDGWSLLETSDGSRPLRELLQDVVRVLDWASLPSSFIDDHPWKSRMEAVHDQGNVRTSAYAAFCYLGSFLSQRTQREQSFFLDMLSFVALQVFEGVAEIPMELVAPFESLILSCRATADVALVAPAAKAPARSTTLAVCMLCRKDLLSARIAYGLSWSDLSLRCTSCFEDVEIVWFEAQWAARSSNRIAFLGKPGEGLRSRLKQLAALSKVAELEGEYSRLEDLETTVRCPQCDASTELFALVADDVNRRCPLARVEGWDVRAAARQSQLAARGLDPIRPQCRIAASCPLLIRQQCDEAARCPSLLLPKGSGQLAAFPAFLANELRQPAAQIDSKATADVNRR